MIISKLYYLNLNNSVNKVFKSNPKQSFDELLSQYTVKKGDTLFNIAKKYLSDKGIAPSNREIYHTINEIAKLNNIKNPNLIFPGQVLLFPENHTNTDAFLFPTKGYISSKYGMRLDPFTKHMRFHSGIDIAAPVGTPVKAAADGKVIFSGVQRGYGNVVILQHKNGMITKYAHNSKNIVKVGDIVKKGETISLVGNSGRSTGPHLHFEVRINNKSINPLKFLNYNRA